MAGMSGLGAMMGGYQEAEGTANRNQISRQQAIEAQNDVMGQQAFGRALQLMFGGGGVVGGNAPGGAPGGQPGGMPPRSPADIPNAGGGPAPIARNDPGMGSWPPGADATLRSTPPMGPQNGPASLMSPVPTANQVTPAFGAVPPGQGQGQPPQVPGQMSPQPMMGQGGPPGGAPPGGPQGQPGAPGGAPPGGPSSAPENQIQRPQAGGRQGPLNLESVMRAVISANPGAPPAVIAAAVGRFTPLMNAQSQLQWREMSLMLREQALQQAQDRFDENQKRLRENAGTRDRNTNRGLDIRERGEDRRGQEGAARGEDRTRRTDLAVTREGRVTRQGDERLGQGNRRLDQADTRETRQDREGRERGDLGNRRQTLAEQREERQARDSEARRELIKERLTQAQSKQASDKLMADAKLKKLQADADKAIQSKDLQTARLRLSAMHQRSQELINEWALAGKIDPKVKAAVLEENRILYREMIDNLGKAPKDGQDLEPGESRVTPAPQGRPQNLRIDPGTGAVAPQ